MLRTLFARLSFGLSLSFVLAAPALGANSSYTVVRGDTLFAIAQRAHVSVSELVRLNRLNDADYLREGQVLQLDTAPTADPKHAAYSSGRTLVRTNARHTKHVARRQVEPSGPAQIAEAQVLWVATHAGTSAPDIYGSGSFAEAQRDLAFEVRLTRTALRYLGVPFVWGGDSFSGVDCSGFVQAVFHRNGVDLPRTADAQFEIGRRVPESGLQPGDLVFFETYAAGASHVGIYLGDGRFVHASASNGVRVDSLSENYYSSRFVGARREPI